MKQYIINASLGGKKAMKQILLDILKLAYKVYTI